MAKVLMNNAGIKIVGWQTEEGFFLRAYEDGVLMEVSEKNPNVEQRSLFIQRWF